MSQRLDNPACYRREAPAEKCLISTRKLEKVTKFKLLKEREDLPSLPDPFLTTTSLIFREKVTISQSHRRYTTHVPLH